MRLALAVPAVLLMGCGDHGSWSLVIDDAELKAAPSDAAAWCADGAAPDVHVAAQRAAGLVPRDPNVQTSNPQISNSCQCVLSCGRTRNRLIDALVRGNVFVNNFQIGHR